MDEIQARCPGDQRGLPRRVARRSAAATDSDVFWESSARRTEPTYRPHLSLMPGEADELKPYVRALRFLLYSSRGLIDADLPSFLALRERLRQMARQRAGLSGVYVLVFETATDRYLGRCDIVVDEGEPVLVGPAIACEPPVAAAELRDRLRELPDHGRDKPEDHRCCG